MSRSLPQQDWTILADHVAPYSISIGYVSTFNAALRDARTCSGRNVENGQLLPEKSSTSWAGVVVYLILLEQIGKSLRPSGRRAKLKGEKPLEVALRHFVGSSTTILQRKVLYALRCAFAHEYGLFNEGSKDLRYRRIFRLDDDPLAPLIKWPSRPWSGDYKITSPAMSTTVGIVAVGNICEEVVRSVRVHHMAGTLRGIIPIVELQKRFGFVVACK